MSAPGKVSLSHQFEPCLRNTADPHQKQPQFLRAIFDEALSTSLHDREGFEHRNLGTTLQHWAAPGRLDCRIK